MLRKVEAVTILLFVERTVSVHLEIRMQRQLTEQSRTKDFKRRDSKVQKPSARQEV
jgi:hypothetical protein